MGAFADRMVNLADRMLRKFGKGSATFTRNTSSSVDPTTLKTGGGETTYTARVAPLNIKEYAMVARSLGLATDYTIAENEKMLYMGVGTEPEKGDTVELDSETWAIKEIEIFETQDTHCAYLLKVGK